MVICIAVGQVLMDEGEHHCPLTDRSCDALDRAASHVTNGVDARNRGLELSHTVGAFPDGLAGQDKPSVVQSHAADQPAGVGLCAGEQEQRANLSAPRAARMRTYRDPLEPLAPTELMHL